MVLELIAGLFAFVLFITVPGYFVTLAFFPARGDLDEVERAAFSFVFSISFLPLLMLIENQLFGLRIDFFSVTASFFLLIIVSLLVYLARTGRVGAPGFFCSLFPKVKREEAVEIIPCIRPKK